MLYTVTNSGLQNGRPTSIGRNQIDLENRATHVFTIANFTTETAPEYSDPEDDALSYVEILSLPPLGSLFLNGNLVTIGAQITSGQISTGNFTYTSADQDDPYSTQWNFDAADVGSNSLSGLDTGVIIFKCEQKVNLPPDVIGDKTIQLEYNETHVFSSSDFLVDYNDPEGDAPKEVKIIDLPVDGTLFFNGSVALVNQIITISEIDSGYLSWVPPGTGTGINTTFNFAVSDVGSGQFSQ